MALNIYNMTLQNIVLLLTHLKQTNVPFFLLWIALHKTMFSYRISLAMNYLKQCSPIVSHFKCITQNNVLLSYLTWNVLHKSTVLHNPLKCASQNIVFLSPLQCQFVKHNVGRKCRFCVVHLKGVMRTVCYAIHCKG
jgi:hypothetical protein